LEFYRHFPKKDGHEEIDIHIPAERFCIEASRVSNASRRSVPKAWDKWAYGNGVAIEFSRPGKPTDNAFIESYNGSVRAQCLNEIRLLSLVDAKEKIKASRVDYNES
jgi:putative transposase